MFYMKKLIIPILIFTVLSCNFDASSPQEWPSADDVRTSLDSLYLNLAQKVTDQGSAEKVIYTSHALGIYEPFVTYPVSASSIRLFDSDIPENEDVDVQLGPNTFYTEKGWYSEGGKTYVSKALLFFSSLYGYPLEIDGANYDYSYTVPDETYMIASAAFGNNSGTEWIRSQSSYRISAVIEDTTNPIVCTFAPSVLDTDIVTFITLEDRSVTGMGFLAPTSGNISFYPLPYSPTGYDPAQSTIKTYSCIFSSFDGIKEGFSDITFDIEYEPAGGNEDVPVLPDAPDTIGIDLLEFHQNLLSAIRANSLTSSMTTEDLEAILASDIYIDFGIPSLAVEEITVLENTYGNGDEFEVQLGEGSYSGPVWSLTTQDHIEVNMIAILLSEALDLPLRIGNQVIECGVYDHSGEGDLAVDFVTFSPVDGNTFESTSSGADIRIGTAGTAVSISFSGLEEDGVIFSRYNKNGEGWKYRIGEKTPFSPVPAGGDIYSFDGISVRSENAIFNDSSNDVSLSGIAEFSISADKEYAASAFMSSFIESLNKENIISDVETAIGQIDWINVFEQWSEKNGGEFDLSSIVNGVIEMDDIAISNNEGSSPFVFTRLVKMDSDGASGPDVDYIDVEMEAIEDFSSFFDDGTDFIIPQGAKAGLRLLGVCNGLTQHPTYAAVVEFVLEGYEFYTLEAPLSVKSDETEYTMSFTSLSGDMSGAFYIDPRSTDPISFAGIISIDDLSAPAASEGLSINNIAIGYPAGL